MLDTTHKLIRRVAKNLSLSEIDIEYLLKADNEHIFDIQLSSGKKFPAYRVQHNNALGPYKGGIRFHPLASIDEVRALALLMSLKTAAVGLPLGGGKGAITVDPKQLTRAELEELSRKYAAHLTKHIGPEIDVPAPDMNTNATVMGWMLDEYIKTSGNESKAAFTGKSIAEGGSLGREAATGRGGAIVLDEILGCQEVTIAVQGFGNVGSFFALVAQSEHPDWRVVAATDSSGGVIAQDLDIKKLDEFKRSGGKLNGYDPSKSINEEQLLSAEVDVLVLAALENIITTDNMSNIKARYILELANGPISEDAHHYLSEKGVVIIPDILANAGGVVVSYLEWLQNKENQQWSEQKVNAQLNEYLIKATDAVKDYARANNKTLKEAAFSLAIKRIIKAKGGNQKRSMNG